MEHKFDKVEDRCSCGGQILYYEDAPLPGEGCDVAGQPFNAPTSDEIADAYEWLGDICDDVPAEMTNAEIITAITRHYEGGWPQFLKDSM